MSGSHDLKVINYFVMRVELFKGSNLQVVYVYPLAICNHGNMCILLPIAEWPPFLPMGTGVCVW